VRDKFQLFAKGWTKKPQFRIIFDKNDMSRVQKQIDKNQSTIEIEKFILNFKNIKKDAKRMAPTSKNFFVLVDHSEVKQKTI